MTIVIAQYALATSLGLFSALAFADGKVITLKVPVNVSNFQPDKDASVVCYLTGISGGMIPFVSKIPLVNGSFNGIVTLTSNPLNFVTEKEVKGYMCQFLGAAVGDALNNPATNKPKITEISGDF